MSNSVHYLKRALSVAIIVLAAGSGLGIRGCPDEQDPCEPGEALWCIICDCVPNVCVWLEDDLEPEVLARTLKGACQSTATTFDIFENPPHFQQPNCMLLSDPWKERECVGDRLGEQRTGLLQSASNPRASFEGPIDFGLSYVRLLKDGDLAADLAVSGKISIVGGNCLTGACPLEVWQLELQPLEDTFILDGATITKTVILNETIWKGEKTGTGQFNLGSESKLIMLFTRNGQLGVREFTPATIVSAEFHFGMPRDKGQHGSVSTNALVLSGSFSDGAWETDLYIHTWLTDCEPRVRGTARCWPGIEGSERLLWLEGHGEILGALEMENHDLCNAMIADDVRTDCEVLGSGEFPGFACTEEKMPETPEQHASQLSWRWEDARGQLLGDAQMVFLDYMPEFPVSVTVYNKWGRKASGVVAAPTNPGSPDCPDPVGIAVTPEVPRNTYLGQSHPNPFNPRTTIRFELQTPGKADLEFYDASGRLLRQLVGHELQAGEHNIVWDGRDAAGRELAPGTYFYRLIVNGIPGGSQKIVILR